MASQKGRYRSDRGRGGARHGSQLSRRRGDRRGGGGVRIRRGAGRRTWTRPRSLDESGSRRSARARRGRSACDLGRRLRSPSSRGRGARGSPRKKPLATRARPDGGGMSQKLRVYEVARDLGLDNKTLVALLQSNGVPDVRNHMSAVGADVVERIKRQLEKPKSPATVEERIHATVVKRRVAVRTGDASAPSNPAPAAAAPPPPPSAAPVATREKSAPLSAKPVAHTRKEEESAPPPVRVEPTPAPPSAPRRS